LGGHAGRLEERAERLDEDLLVLALVPLRIGSLGELSGCKIPSVPASNVCRDTAKLLRRTSLLVDVGKFLSSGLCGSISGCVGRLRLTGRLTEVIVPAEPASVAGIHVHDNVGQVKALKRVRNTITVTSGRILAGLEVLVGNKVGQAVGLDNQGNGGVGVLLEDGNDGWYELVPGLY
jgi:hypothetical protein